MPLHRRVYLIGALVAALTATVSIVGLTGDVRVHDQTESFARHDAQVLLLAAAQRDVEQSQVSFTAASVLPKNQARRTAFVQASAQQQLGLTEWSRFRASSSHQGALPGAAQLTADLASLAYADHGTSSAATTTPTPTMIAIPALRVAADFSTVRRSEDDVISAEGARQRATSRGNIARLLTASVLVLLAIIAALALLARAARRRDAELAERDRDLERVSKANEFEARLQRALELAATEDRIYGVVEQALHEVAPELSVEMLLADSSRAHFQQLVTTGTEPTHRCAVDSPTECPAAQRGEVMTFASSRALDACHYLKQHGTECSAVCVPVSVSGLTVGVVHAAGAPGRPPDADGRATLKLIAQRASDRIGTMRAFSDSEIQASTDPLTGLPNRRSLENAIRRLSAHDTPYTVAFGDLDHFKTVNDKFGHAAGDHALRVFAKVLGEQLRPDDLCGRYGGEEFLIVLPHCSDVESVQILDRLRIALGDALLTADCPTFTVSFGVAVHSPGQPFEDVVSLADGALLGAKRQGRDRVVVARPDTTARPAAAAAMVVSGLR